LKGKKKYFQRGEKEHTFGLLKEMIPKQPKLVETPNVYCPGDGFFPVAHQD